jgi:hypothetical protein
MKIELYSIVAFVFNMISFSVKAGDIPPTTSLVYPLPDTIERKIGNQGYRKYRKGSRGIAIT